MRSRGTVTRISPCRLIRQSTCIPCSFDIFLHEIVLKILKVHKVVDVVNICMPRDILLAGLCNCRICAESTEYVRGIGNPASLNALRLRFVEHWLVVAKSDTGTNTSASCATHGAISMARYKWKITSTSFSFTTRSSPTPHRGVPAETFHHFATNRNWHFLRRDRNSLGLGT